METDRLEIGSWAPGTDEVVAAADFLPFFMPDAASSLLSRSRWKDGYECPKCASRSVKKINSAIVAELLKCVDCGYAFNFRSGTPIQGSKLQPNLILQLLFLRDLFDVSPPPRIIAGTLNIAEQTVRSNLAKLRLVPTRKDYIRANAGQQAPERHDMRSFQVRHEVFHSFVKGRALAIRVGAFEDRVHDALSSEA